MQTQTGRTTFETEDIALCAYLKMKGLAVLDYDASRYKIRFILDNPGNICKKLQLEYLNSECREFDSVIKDLRKIFKQHHQD